MNKKEKAVLIVCGAVLAAGIAGSAAVLLSPHGNIVEITRDGELICRLDLSKEENRTFAVEYEGRTNVILIEDGRICVAEADCPDKVCVSSGWLEGALPIVCLPNHLKIAFSDGDTNGDIDAATR